MSGKDRVGQGEAEEAISRKQADSLGLDLSRSFEIRPLEVQPPHWSMEGSLGVLERDGLDLTSGPDTQRRKEKVSISRKDIEGLDLSTSGSKSLSIKERPRVQDRPSKPIGSRSAPNIAGSEKERSFHAHRKYVPFLFLIIAGLAYVYIISRVVIGFDLPEFFHISISNAGLLSALVVILTLTIAANQVWRFYVLSLYRKRTGNRGGGRT